MTTLIYIFLLVASLKIALNAARHFRCRRYINFYLQHITEDTWELTEHKPRIIELIKGAGVPDNYVPHVQPIGFGQFISSKVSVMRNLSNSRQDISNAALAMLFEAKGTYRTRTLETLNPLYWVELVINLPRIMLEYVGVSSESIVVRSLQVVWWIFGSVSSFLYALYRPDVEQLVRDWISNLTP